DLAKSKEIDNDAGEFRICESGSVEVLKPQDGCSTQNLSQ
ncbi:hypothetical protein Tco_1566324, partial [Tanacetum coccineum]